MSKIESVHAIEILDSRGNPTIKVTVMTDEGFCGKAAVPSGASTGENEAVEVRDKEEKRYFGKGVRKAVLNVNETIASILKGQNVYDQERLDQKLIEADGTPNKSKLGANAILGASLAIAQAAAQSKKIPLYRYIGGENNTLLPCPMMNIINGGAHANNKLDFQEFMIRPIGAPSFKEAIRFGAEVFHTLKNLLLEKGYSVAVGDEGGFAPQVDSNEEALDLIIMAIEKAGFRPKKDISIALDCAASEFYDKSSGTYQEKKKVHKGKIRTSDEQIDYLASLAFTYPIDTIEDGLDQNDWKGWNLLTKKLGDKLQLIGDDIFVTNPVFLERAIKEKVGNSILIKLNQIGTLTETLNTIQIAKKNGYKTVISHRSGETEDTFIADLAVATSAGQIKTGSLSRSDRVAKYNRLLEIEDELQDRALFNQAN